MTREQEKIELGEREGLRQVMGVYGATNFYTGYFKEPKLKMTAFEADILKEEKLLQQLKDALTAVSQAKEKAKEKLETALAEQIVLEGKDELEKAVASFGNSN